MSHSQLAESFGAVDREIAGFEQRIGRQEALPLEATVDQALSWVGRLMGAWIADEGRKPVPDAAADILDVFKVLVKGEPTWNAIRDNCRELVYYRNCINMERRDALPPVPAKMAVRTARHVYLYIKTRAIREGRLED